MLVSTLPTSQKTPSLLQVNFSNLTYSRLAKVSTVLNIVLLRSLHSRFRSALTIPHPHPSTQNTTALQASIHTFGYGKAKYIRASATFQGKVPVQAQVGVRDPKVKSNLL